MNTTRRALIAFFLVIPFMASHSAMATDGDDEFLTVYIVANVPPETQDVYITGNIEHFGPWWGKKEIMVRDGDRRIYVMEVPKRFRMEYKFTLGDWEHEAARKNGRKLRNFRMRATENGQIFEHDIINWTGDWKAIE